MAMKEESGMVFLDQLQKSLESLVRQIPAVIQLIGRGMCHQNIKSAMAQKLEPESADPPSHLTFCILVISGPVPHRSAQSKDTHPLIDIDLIFNADTSAGRMLIIFVIMIAMHIQHRR